eukprot:1483248-Amphidinium_carterae.1
METCRLPTARVGGVACHKTWCEADRATLALNVREDCRLQGGSEDRSFGWNCSVGGLKTS